MFALFPFKFINEIMIIYVLLVGGWGGQKKKIEVWFWPKAGASVRQMIHMPYAFCNITMVQIHGEIALDHT